jgi:choice-of-anchor B domain-containing protein
MARFSPDTAACFFFLVITMASNSAFAADVTFNISFVGESNPLPPASSTTWSYAEVWGEGDYAYVGSDRSGRGMSIFDISKPANPQFIRNPANPTGTITLSSYSGSEMEDVEVYNGIGYFGSDVNATTGRTGVDIIDLSNPATPVRLSRVDSSIGGHDKVHTLSVSKGFLYTVDNEADAAPDSVKIFNVSNPANPQFVANVVIGIPDTNVAAHEVVVLNDRMYVASKWNGSNTCCGWTTIYDVSNPASPVKLKQFDTGPRTHTVWPTDDGKTIIVAQERSNGDLRIYDVSMINQANDPDTPALLKTLNRTSLSLNSYTPHHPFLKGNLLFMAWYESGLQVFNIADPANPVRVGAFDTYAPNYSDSNPEHGDWGVYAMLGLDRVLLGDRDRGLIIVDATGVLAPGDYDQNGVVDARDFSTWRGAVGTANKAADGDKNGIVDAGDYVIWRKHLGQTLPPGLGAGASSSVNDFLPVPEPTTMTLLSFGLAVGISYRCRRRYRRRQSLRFLLG